MLQREPQPTAPIEDQILEAIISNALPTAADSSHSTSNIPNPTSLASHFRLPLSKILDILASPLTRTRIAAAQELRDLAFHQREQLAREKALAALEAILDTSEDPIEKRRAATAILRRSSTKNPFWPRTPGGGAGAAATLDDDDDQAPRPRLPPAEHPEWDTPPRESLVRLLTRLQDNNNPEPNDGLATLFLYKAREEELTQSELVDALNDYLDDPGEDANLVGFSCAIIHAPDPTPATLGAPSAAPSSPNTHTERVTLHWPSHRRTVLFHFTICRTFDSYLWDITSIDIGPKESDTDSS